MKRLLTLTLALLPGALLAQPAASTGSTKAQQEFANALTAASRFGVPRYTTALLPTCNTANKGALAFDTTLGQLKICDGTNWGSSASGVTAGDLELRDSSQLGSESLTNGALTGGTSWTAAGDFALASDAATYTHSAGSGTIAQASVDAAIPWAQAGINGWFSFTYTTSAVTGTPVCTLTTAFAASSTDLTEAAGTTTVVFQAKSTTVGAFTISCTSAAAATVTFDTLSLKQVNGGDLTVHGRVLKSDGTAALPSDTWISDSDTGFSKLSTDGYFGSSSNGTRYTLFGPVEFQLSAGTLFCWSSGAPSVGGCDTRMGRGGTANFRFGDDHSATPVAQTLSFQGSTGTNVAGVDATIVGSLGTGTAASGTLLFQVGTPQASGTTQHVAATVVTLQNVGAAGAAAPQAVFAEGSAANPVIRGSDADSGIYFATGQLVLVDDGQTAAYPSSNGWVVGAGGLDLSAVGSNAFWDRTLTPGGTTGAQTINKAMGSVNFAAAATSLVVTNSQATTTSLIFLTPQTNDATCNTFTVTRAAGSFTITTPVACTAETTVAFWVAK